MMARSLLVVVNPNAGGTTALHKWYALEQTLRSRGVPYSVCLTERRGHGAELAALAQREERDCIVAVGGDGTLNEVINGVLLSGSLRLPVIGYVPAGSSNDFTKNFGGGNGSFLARLEAGRPVPVHAGKIECRDVEGKPVTRYFLVNSTVGVIAGALEFFNRTSVLTRTMKKVSVDLAVVWSAVNAIARHESRTYQVTVDGDRMPSKVLTNLAVLRGSFFGGGMSYGEAAQPPEGLFRFVGVDDMSKIGRLGTLSRLYLGSILSHPRVWSRPGREITIDADEGCVIEADGELVGFLPARFSLSDTPLEMIY